MLRYWESRHAFLTFQYLFSFLLLLLRQGSFDVCLYRGIIAVKCNEIEQYINYMCYAVVNIIMLHQNVPVDVRRHRKSNGVVR
jgi:hypothetical protein